MSDAMFSKRASLDFTPNRQAEALAAWAKVKGASDLGLQDMSGNVSEWTADWYDEEFYLKNPAINPRGPAEGTAKVQRGGSYTNTPYRLRSTFRTKGDPTEHDPNVGFRCAQDVAKQP